MIGQRRHFQVAHRPRNDDESILPLINIVFLLLIFFMVAGQLSAVDPFEVEPVESAVDGQPGPDEFMVIVGTEGRLAVNQDEIDLEGMARLVAEHLQRHGDAARVRVKADGRAEAVDVVGILERLREAGVERIDLLTVPET
ncbi:biopolymer transporter ExbD [Thioalkalivibrio sp. AKL17]|uniref:ExbD/TolR family protein n=1 Tax=Thioalkalivibrio sp. AKL17 TaxID=1158160 RepID=UPI00037289F4|nr:biopolymer transporter ExbD [Thioalkalivibrio sp. AKL17]